MNFDHLVDRRIQLVAMGDDPDPVPSGSLGTVVSVCEVQGAVHLSVAWDNGRGLNLICPPDQYIILNS